MSVTEESPTKAKGLVEFTAAKGGALALTDKIETTENGTLTQAACRTKLEFTVQYEGYWFAIHADQQGTYATLKIHGIIGKLPFSYQSAFARTNIHAVVAAACKEIKGKMRIDDKQRILIIDEVRVKGSLSPKVILGETTKTLLKLRPYLKLVTSLQPPKDASVKAPDNYIRQEDIEPEEIEPEAPEAEEPVKVKRPLSERIKKNVTIKITRQNPDKK